MKRKFVALECILCLVLLLASVILQYRSKSHAVSVGYFGKEQLSNDTLSDLANNLFGELFNE